MFVSFFPSPKAFFTSAALWSLAAVLFWFFVAKNSGVYFGLPNPPEGAEPIIGAQVFVSKPFIWFYLYYAAIVGVFSAIWWSIEKHPWFQWSVLGTALIIFLTYFSVEMSVAVNAWYGPFYDLLNAALTKQRVVAVGELYMSLLIFAGLAATTILIYSFMTFFFKHYVFRWRDAMHHFYASRWSELRAVEGASQRVQDDTMQFARGMENEGTSVLQAIMTLIAFLPILYGYSKHITELPIVGAIPNALVWASIFWALFGTAFIALIGSKLPGLEFRNQRVEAALRKELVLGEDDPARADPPTLKELFTGVRKNYFRLYFNYLYFDIGRRIYGNADTVYSLILLFPSIVAGTMSLGLFQQISNAFDKVRGAFQTLVDDWQEVVKLVSIYKRLRAFEATLEGSPLQSIETEIVEKMVRDDRLELPTSSV
jgi:peptide/bleomycin uptake transporter